MATATDQVYNATTVQAPKNGKWFIVPTENLSKIRCAVKVVEVNTKEDILKNVGNRTSAVPIDLHWFCVHTIEVNGYRRCSVTNILQNIFFWVLWKKVIQLFSCVAFVVEEIVSNCSSCGPLYFFEFVSCTAFLFTLLLLILLATKLHQRVGINSWPTLDFSYTIGMAVLFFLASIVFAADNGGTALEQTAVIFGFLATIAFLSDFGFFFKEKGIPCKQKTSQPTDNTTGQLTEHEKLNSNGTD